MGCDTMIAQLFVKTIWKIEKAKQRLFFVGIPYFGSKTIHRLLADSLCFGGAGDSGYLVKFSQTSQDLGE